MSFNSDMAAGVVEILEEAGFDVVLQRKVQAASDLDTSGPSWQNVATKRAVWNVEGYAREALQDGGAASQTRLAMFLAYTATS